MNNYIQELLFMLLALILVVGIALLVLKALKGIHTKQGDGARIDLLLTLPVGTRERVVVITYRDNEYLVGITAGGMSLLDKMPKPEPVDTIVQEHPKE
jgi:flagellar biogenesis protein FliO